MYHVKSFSYHIIFTTRLPMIISWNERGKTNDNLSSLKQLLFLALQLAEFIGLIIKHHWAPATPRAFSPKLPTKIAEPSNTTHRLFDDLKNRPKTTAWWTHCVAESCGATGYTNILQLVSSLHFTSAAVRFQLIVSIVPRCPNQNSWNPSILLFIMSPPSTTFPTHHSKQSFFWGVTSPRVPHHLAFHWCRSSYIRFGGATTAATTMEEGEFHDLRSKTLYLLTSILSLRHWQGKTWTNNGRVLLIETKSKGCFT